MYRTSDVPLTIAAGVSAAGGPLLAPAPSYVVTGTGFAANDTEVLLGTVPLQPSGAAAPAAGQFGINEAGTALTLVPPAALRAGTYQIRVRVAGIESDPALWWLAA